MIINSFLPKGDTDSMSLSMTLCHSIRIYKSLCTHYADFNMLSLINIEKLNGTNFKAWKQKVEMHLGMLEFDIAFKLPQPLSLTDDNTSLQRDRSSKWERANQMSLLIMQNVMEDGIRGRNSVCDLAKEYMAKIQQT